MGNISFVRVGGMCAVLAVMCGIQARIFFDSGDLVAGHWFDLLWGLFSIPAVLGVYHFMHKAGTVLWIAVAAFVIGITFGSFNESVWLGIRYELLPDTLSPTGWLAGGIGGGLISFVGVPLFSFVILRIAMVPKWIGWLGMVAVVANVVLVMVLSGVIERIGPHWYMALGTVMAWMLAMGVVMLRLKEPVAPDSVA